jgi:hypothetical protein
MNTDERLLETCIHEAAHFALCVWTGFVVNSISIGDQIYGKYTSGGYVAYTLSKESNTDIVAAIACAGAAIDEIRGKLTFEEIYDGSQADRDIFASILKDNGLNVDAEGIQAFLLKGLALAKTNLAESSKYEQVVCIGTAIFNKCVDGKVFIPNSDLQDLYDGCRES